MRQNIEKKENLVFPQSTNKLWFSFFYFILFYFTNPDNFRIVDIEINAESPLFINLILH